MLIGCQGLLRRELATSHDRIADALHEAATTLGKITAKRSQTLSPRVARRKANGLSSYRREKLLASPNDGQVIPA